MRSRQSLHAEKIAIPIAQGEAEAEAALLEYAQHLKVKANVSLIAIFVVLALTVLFEYGHHWLTHKLGSIDKRFINILNTLYKEFVILGFLGLSLFMMIYSGAAMFLNDKYLGVGVVEKIARKDLAHEGENPRFAPTVLGAMVENLMLMLFAVMCFYALLVGFHLTCAIKQVRQWAHLQHQNFSFFHRAAQNYKKGSPRETFRFWILKYRMNHRRSPFGGNPRKKGVLNSHHEGFDFGEYLGERYISVVCQLIDIGVAIWLIFLPVLLLFRPLMDFDMQLQAQTMLGLAIFLAITSVFISVNLNQALSQLHPNLDEVISVLKSSADIHEWEERHPQQAPYESHGFKIKKLSKMQRFIQRCKINNIQESLLFFGRRGQHFSVSLIQFVLLFHVVLLTVNVDKICDSEWLKDVYHGTGLWLALTPMAILLLSATVLWPGIVKSLVIFTSVELMTDIQLIKKMEQEAFKRFIKRRNQIINHMIVNSNFDSIDNREKSMSSIEEASLKADAQRQFLGLPPKTRTDLVDLFNAFSIELQDGTRFMTLIGVLQFQKFVNLPARTKRLMQGRIVRKCPDGLSFDDFCLVLIVAAATSQLPEEQSPRQLQAEVLFNFLDIDEDGKISVEDLTIALQGLLPPITEFEIWNLLSELGGTGEAAAEPFEVEKSQLEHWLETQHLLRRGRTKAEHEDQGSSVGDDLISSSPLAQTESINNPSRPSSSSSSESFASAGDEETRDLLFFPP